MTHALKRNLVVCCDGTWNTPDQKDRQRIAPTNVVKMARAILTPRDGMYFDLGKQGVTIALQEVFYDTGLGTGENHYGPDQTPEKSGWSSKFSSAYNSLRGGDEDTGLKDRLLAAVDKLAGGGGGLGISEKIIDGYRWLSDNYQEGDRIFLFGFSRGAYTVRSLSGLIELCGLVPAGDEAAINDAWDLYHSGGDENAREAQRTLADKRGWKRVPIRFLGVWDTVGALGVPKLTKRGTIQKFWDRMTDGGELDSSFHSVHLSRIVEYAAHALALDERRGPFAPSIWRRRAAKPGASGKKGKDDNPDIDRVQQVWFAGVHSNVGGGYVDAGLSDHAFMWMAQRAINAGLILNPMYMAHRIDPNAHGELRDTLSAFYKKIPQFVRELDSVDDDDNPALNEMIHSSVRFRWASPTNNYWLPRVRGKTAQHELLKFFENSKLRTDEGLSLITRAESTGPSIERFRAMHGVGTYITKAKESSETTPGIEPKTVSGTEPPDAWR